MLGQPYEDRHQDGEEAGKEGGWRGVRGGVWDLKLGLINDGLCFSFV